MFRSQRLKKIIAWILALIFTFSFTLDLSLTSSAAEIAEDQVYRIKNSHLADAWLYEAEGQVLYGTPENEEDSRFLWQVELDADGLGNARIKNVATGHYMNYKDQLDYNAPMQCLEPEEATNSLFDINSIEEGGITKYNIIASTNTNLVVHVEQNYGHAQCSNWAQAGWGTAKWLFLDPDETEEPEEPGNPGDPEEQEEPGDISAGLLVKIKNSFRADTYLYEDEGKVLYGKPSSVFDLRYYWVVESNADGNGNSRIRNAATGHYMNYMNAPDYNEAVECVDITEATNVLFDINAIEEGGITVQNIIASTNPNLVVHVEQSMGHAQCSNWAQASWGTAKWIFEDAGEKTPQGLAFKIKNAYTQTTSGDAIYLYESNGEVLYGPLESSSDTSFYWFFTIDENGDYTIRNWKTGHFIVYKDLMDHNFKMRALDYEQVDVSSSDAISFSINSFTDNGIIKHNIESAVNPGIRVHTEGFAFPVCSNWAQNFFGSAQWLFIDAVSSAPTEVLTPNGYTRIKNDWSGQYLYEDNGKVRYGQPASHNPLSHWEIIELDGHYRIRNVGTGHYFNYRNQTDYNEPIECLEQSELTFADFNITETVVDGISKNTIIASTNSNLVVHVEQQTGYAQCSNWAQASWGSAKWVFEPASDDIAGGPVKEEIPLDQDPAAALNDGDIIRLKNSWREMYLYQAEDGKAAYGNVNASDLRSQWTIETEGENVRLMNRATGEYLSVENGRGYAECVALDASTLFNQWEIVTAPNTVSGLKTLRCAGWNDTEESGENSFYLHTEGDKGYAEYGPIPPSWGSPQWIITRVSPDDPSTGYVRLRNRTTGNYLYEQDGKVAFGTASEIETDNALSHWVIERTIRYTRIKNRATGNYISAEGLAGLLDPLALTSTANSLNSVWTIESTGDGYFTLENMNKDGWFIHNANEITTAFAQCSKLTASAGTSQWAFEEAPEEIARTLPTGYVRIKSRAGDQYLFENKKGAVLYGNLENDNTAYQWKLEQDGESFTIVNKYTGNYLALAEDKPFLVTLADDSADNAHWSVDAAPVSNYSILSNSAAPARFVNINANLGFAQGTVLSNEKTTAQWSFETPSGGADDPVYGEDATDTATPVVSEHQYFALRNKAKGQYINDNGETIGLALSSVEASSQWMLEDYNGYRRIKNRETGRYLQILAQDGMLLASSDGAALGSQWKITERSGYQTIESANVLFGSVFAEISGLRAKPADNADDMLWKFEPVTADNVFEAEKAFIAGDAIAVGNLVTGFNKAGDRVVFTVNTNEAGNYNVVLSYGNESAITGNMSVFVNGVKKSDISLPTSHGAMGTVTTELPLNKGINTISYQVMSNISSQIVVDAITVEDSINTAYKGATLPYVTYEAEDAQTNASVVGPSIQYYTFASEASGRKAVTLEDASDYIQFELAEAANAFVIRYVLPDAEEGGGTTQTIGLYADGQKIRDIPLSSEHSWVYGSYPWSNSPADGKPHRYYEEARFMLESPLPEGSVLKLQKDNADAYCIIDLVDAEKVDAPNAMPQDFLSITAFGAIPNDGQDDTAAMAACIAAARAQNKGVWLPAGTFNFLNGSRGAEGIPDTRIIVPGNVVIKGAGVWHTTLKGPFAGFMVKGSNTGFYDFTIEAEEVTREDAHGTTGIESDYNTLGMTNLTVQNVWFSHTKTGMWLHNMKNAHIVGSRVRNTYADGLHLSKGTTHSLVEQNNVRYSGDDGIALWSQEYADVDNTIRFNTVELPWLANNMAIYGGENNRIEDNILRDTIAFGGGINISSNFSPMPFTGSVTVERNALIRAGGHEYNFNVDYGAIRIDTTVNIDADIIFSNNTIYDASYQGVSVHGPSTISHLVFENNVIDGTGTWGINAVSGSKGNAAFYNMIIRNAGVENIYNPTPGGADGLSFSYPEDWRVHDAYAPEWPVESTLKVLGTTQTTAQLDWDAAQSEVEIDEYVVILPGQVRHLANDVTSLNVTGLQPGTSYTFSVFAKDIYGNQSDVLTTSAATRTEGSDDTDSPQPPADAPVSGVKATISKGIASASISGDLLANLLEQATGNGEKNPIMEVEIEAVGDADGVQLDIPAGAFTEVARAESGFKLTSALGSITFDSKAVTTIAAGAASGNVSIKMTKVNAAALPATLRNIAGSRPVYEFSVLAGNKEISNFRGGNASIRVPYALKPGENPDSVVVYFIDDAGNLKPVRGVYHPSTGSVTFRTTHFSRFMIGYKAVVFNDAKSGDWFYNAVNFAAARNITAGTGSDNFSPAAETTRAQFVVMLLKAYDIEPAAPSADNFADAGNAFYSGYVAKAKELGITSGAGNNKFAPEARITRQEMFTMLYNTLKAIGELPEPSGPASLDDFSDAAQIASYAKEPMRLLISAGMISGNAGKLTPKGTATRAQVVQIIYNLLSH